MWLWGGILTVIPTATCVNSVCYNDGFNLLFINRNELRTAMPLVWGPILWRAEPPAMPPDVVPDVVNKNQPGT